MSNDLLSAIGGVTVKNIKHEKYTTGIDILDVFAGGGFPDGGWSLIVGDSGAGKSTLCLQIAGAIQRNYPNTKIIIVDTEKSIRPERIASLGADPENIIYWMRKDGKPITIEAVFNELFHNLINYKIKNKDDSRFVVIWDSIAMTPSEGELEDIANQATLQAVALTKGLKGYYQLLVDYKILVLAVNHYRDKIKMGPYQARGVNELPKLKGTIPGGNQQIYAAQHLLELTVKSVFNDKDVAKYGYYGAYITGEFYKNKFITPYRPFIMILSNSKGFDNLMTNAYYLLEAGVLKQKGAYITMHGYDKSFYFKDIRNLYQSDEKFRMIFDKLVEVVIKQKLYEELKKSSVQHGTVQSLPQDTTEPSAAE